jgi:hypothetical protein
MVGGDRNVVYQSVRRMSISSLAICCKEVIHACVFYMRGTTALVYLGVD